MQFQDYACLGVILERVTFPLVRFDNKTFRCLKSVSEVSNEEPNGYGFSGIILRMTVGRNAWLY